ncbi:hypothetical protein PMG11_11345 [Penicillium brasilianum]|uniref:Uncharacterized protein n=1 Tax=Penicillium brasilianum TaxID=104259 RepID=A0A0F7U500_PENBI|nr:hypothetical protein PMG11_11345 [Penicillium brasilianum]
MRQASSGMWALPEVRTSFLCPHFNSLIFLAVCRLGLDCSYDNPDIIQNATTTRIPTPEDPGNTSRVTLALPMELDPLAYYPIQERWYMPFLRQQFLQDFGMSKSSVDLNSIAYQMRTVYMRESSTDPCMFHASLYAASAHLDAARNDCENPVTLYHQTQTLQLVRQRIEQSHRGIDEGLDGAIAGVIPLAFFTVSLSLLAKRNVH